MTLTFGLWPRDAQALDQRLKDLYDPGSPQFRKFLTPEQVAAQFGPSAGDYQALVDFAVQHHFQVLRSHRSRLFLSVRARAADVQEALHLGLRRFQRKDGSQFFAPDHEPAFALSPLVRHISGLDNFGRVAPRSKAAVAGSQLHPAAGTGPACAGSGSYMAKDLRHIYVPCTALNGAGQTVALVEFDNYYNNDVIDYSMATGIGVPPITRMPVDQGAVQAPGCNTAEVALDVEMLMAMAPGIQILVYEGPYGDYCSSGGPQMDVVAQIADDDLASVVSCSWGWDGAGDPDMDQVCKIFALQGQTFLVAAGDFGAYKDGAPDPEPLFPLFESSWMTVVGGTSLSSSGGALGGTYVGESTWNQSPGAAATQTPAVPAVGSGGVCEPLALPDYQAPFVSALNGGSSLYRNIPDVSLVAENIFYVANNGVSSACGKGTSFATPLWAGFIALVDQQTAAAGLGPVGFINPALYGLAGSPAGYSADFHDVQDGSNNDYWGTQPSIYQAVAGYDLATGLGSPQCQLIADLAGQAPTVTATFTASPSPTASPTPGLPSPTPTPSCCANAGSLVSLYAGGGGIGDGGDGGPAIAASMQDPTGLCMDSQSNLFICDTHNYVVRKVGAGGLISTVAGNGYLGYFGDGGKAPQAELGNVYYVAVDAAGNLYLCDQDAALVRKVSPSGRITLFAGVYHGLPSTPLQGDGGPATSAPLEGPQGLAADKNGNVYISGYAAVRKVNAAGVISDFAGTGTGGFSGDGGAATSAELNWPSGLCLDPAGDLYIADSYRIRKVNTAGVISTVTGNGAAGFSGDGGPATAAQIGNCRYLAYCGGNLYLADGNRVRMVNAAGVINTISGGAAATTSAGGVPASTEEWGSAMGLAADSQGNLYGSDNGFNNVRQLAANCSIPTPSITPTFTVSPSLSPTSSLTATRSATVSPSFSATRTATRTPTVSPTVTGTRSFTASPTSSASFSASPTPTATRTGTASPTSTRTYSVSPTSTPTRSFTASPTSSPTATASRTPTASSTPTHSATGTATPSRTPDSSPSDTGTVTPSASPTASPSASGTPSTSPTASPSFSPTGSPSPSPSPWPTATLSPTATSMPSASATTTGMAGNGQPGRILQAMPVPNPNPTGLAVQLDGPADGVAVKIYSKALTRVLNLKVDRRLSAGWSTVALPVGWSSGMARGLYYVVVRPITGGAEGKGPGPVKLVCLR